MAPTPWQDCGPCNKLALILVDLGLGRWQPQDDPAGRHCLTTGAAVRAHQSASEDQVADLRDQLEAVEAAGRVAWVDATPRGEFVVYQGPHGLIPVAIPGPRK